MTRKLRLPLLRLKKIVLLSGLKVGASSLPGAEMTPGSNRVGAGTLAAAATPAEQTAATIRNDAAVRMPPIRATLDLGKVYSRVLPNCAPLVARWSDMSQQAAPAA